MRLAGILFIAACHHGAAPPPSPSCAAVAEHVGALIGERPGASAVRDVVATRCASDRWRDDARACMLATTSLDNPQRCKARLTTAQRGAFERSLAARSAGGLARAPEACQSFHALLVQLTGCVALPAAQREALRKTFRDSLQDWARSAGRDLDALSARCKRMHDGLRQDTSAACGS